MFTQPIINRQIEKYNSMNNINENKNKCDNQVPSLSFPTWETIQKLFNLKLMHWPKKFSGCCLVEDCFHKSENWSLFSNEDKISIDSTAGVVYEFEFAIFKLSYISEMF